LSLQMIAALLSSQEDSIASMYIGFLDIKEKI
jgi:hypothetical protein